MGSVAGIEAVNGEDIVTMVRRTEWSDIAHLLPFLRPGDLIQFRRDLFDHWGVYIGTPENHSHRVIHLTGADGDEELKLDELGGKTGSVKGSLESAGEDVAQGRLPQSHSMSSILAATVKESRDAEVRCDDIVDVARTSRCRVDNSRDLELRPYLSEEVVERAIGSLGVKKYHLLLTNCEHFASWCRYGDKRSDQVSPPESGRKGEGRVLKASVAKTVGVGVVSAAVSGSVTVGLAAGAVVFLASAVTHKLRSRYYRRHRPSPF